MMLRSSSTPILGSLLPPIQEGSNTTFKHHLPPPPPSPTTAIHRSHGYNKLSHVAFTIPNVSCNSSPRSPSVADHKGIRRAQSEGNLQGLAYTSCKDDEDFCNTNQPRNNKFLGRNKCLMLESIPSFSYSTLRGRREEDESEWEDDDDDEEREGCLDENDEEMLQRNGIGGKFCLNNNNKIASKEVKVMETNWDVGFERERGMVDLEMHLAKGLGIGGRGGGGGGQFNWTGSGGDDGDTQGVEEYYKKMVKENPANPLFLSNYAQFLYQNKQDLPKAEEYYSRAILADPGDGESLSQYAKIVWELHNDHDRAATYYERALHASPDDSHVHASYAGFLWETEEDDEECEHNAPADLDSADSASSGSFSKYLTVKV